MDLAHDQFIHVRIIIGIVTGLTVTRLLTGLARFVQHPVRDRIYLAHLAWAFFLLLAIVHFWWFEFGLQRIGVWTFEIYLFVICFRQRRADGSGHDENTLMLTRHVPIAERRPPPGRSCASLSSHSPS